MSVTIPLSSRHTLLIDEGDVELISKYKWYAQVDYRSAQRTVYAVTGHAATTLSLHRLLMGSPKNALVDHRNGNGLDNRRRNLRLCTSSQNQANARVRSDNSSGYRGVTWHRKSAKWNAYISVSGKRKHLGLFVDPWDAAEAYNAAALEVFGEFARLNAASEVLHG